MTLKLKVAISATFLGLAGPVFAGETAININATVPGVCEFRPVAGGADDPSAPITLSIDANGSHAGLATATAETKRSLHLACNQPFVVHLASEQGAVRRQSSVNGGSGNDTPILGGTMAKAIAYQATPRMVDLDTANFTGTYSTLTANQNLQSGFAPSEPLGVINTVRTDAAGDNSGGAYDGILEIAISTQSSPTLVAGYYRDTLTVILLAQ